MYSMGIPIGIFVDTRGSRPAVIAGSILMALGYFPLRHAYLNASAPMFLLCLYSFCTGFGGCAAFAAAIKTSALNWPHHRGTATAFPLAAFGLSAFFFSMLSQFVFKGDPGVFLTLLAFGCSGTTFVGFFFLQVLPHAAYSHLPSGDDLVRTDSNQLERTDSVESKHARRREAAVEPGRSWTISLPSSTEEILNRHPDVEVEASAPGTGLETNETSSLMSNGSSNIGYTTEPRASVDKNHLHHIDIRGLKMLPKAEFWFFFSLMGISTGVGLMTIK